METVSGAESDSVGLLQPAPERSNAALYYADEAKDYSLDEVRKEADRLGFDVLAEIDGPDPDGSKLKDSMDGVKALGVTTLLIPNCVAAVLSPAALMTLIGDLNGAGIRLLAVLEPKFDTTLPEVHYYLDLYERVRKGGISRGNTRWAAERRAEGKLPAASSTKPKCANCGHKVQKRMGGKCHIESAGGTVSPCFKPGCQCTVYTPYNASVMGPAQ